ncbi:MAG: hypothetical protein QM783_16230 [Phycisphaerales bacterium]
MNTRSISPQNLVTAAALVAPIVMVQAARMLFGSAPSQASAAAPTLDPVPAVAPAHAEVDPRKQLTAAQRAAATELAAQHARMTVFNSPFNHLAARPTVIQNDQVVATTPDNTKSTTIPTEIQRLSLGALMRNDHGSFAVISGRVRGIGDAVIPGWKITDIDPAERKVTLTSDEGASVTLTRQ